MVLALVYMSNTKRGVKSWQSLFLCKPLRTIRSCGASHLATHSECVTARCYHNKIAGRNCNFMCNSLAAMTFWTICAGGACKPLPCTGFV